jgi:hypothetical protein
MHPALLIEKNGLSRFLSTAQPPQEHRAIIVNRRKCQTAGVPRQSRGFSRDK